MPVHELGYRHWEGERRPPALRWIAISRAGIEIAFRSKILRRLAFFAWTPVLVFGLFFYGVGVATELPKDLRKRTGAPDIARCWGGTWRRR
jgi:hypothetical protein